MPRWNATKKEKAKRALAYWKKRIGNRAYEKIYKEFGIMPDKHS